MNDRNIQWELVDREYQLWAMAIILYGAGDTITTLWGVSTEGVSEIGPIVGPLMEQYGVSGLFIAKLSSIVVFGLIWYLLWKPTRVAVPLALIVVGGTITVWNTVMILS